MQLQKIRLPLIVLAVVVLAADVAWALGFRLGEAKEQLKLQYEVAVTDHGTGRVTVSLSIADPGRLGPLTSVDLVIPNNESKDGSGPVDLSVSLATREVDDKQVASVHLKRELAERAEIQLKTSNLDGKQQPLTWYYHAIPLAQYFNVAERK